MPASYRMKPKHGTYELDRGHPMTRGLRAFFPMTEGVGQVTHDIVHGIPGRLINSTWKQGRSGPEVLCLAASNGFIDVGVEPRLNFNAGLMIACWYQIPFDLTPAAVGNLVSRDDETDGRSFALLTVNTGGAWLQMQGNGTASEARALVSGEERVVMGWHDPDLTGTFVKSSTDPVVLGLAEAPPVHTTGPVYIGRRSYTAFEGNWNGSIKAVALWDRFIEPVSFIMDPMSMLRSKTP